MCGNACQRVKYKEAKMIAFLTSSPGGQYQEEDRRVPTALNTENGFASRLKGHWRAAANGLLISAEPEAAMLNDGMCMLMKQSFQMSGLSVNRLDVCDSRFERAAERIAQYDFVILGGGHVPTQNAFFQKINLKRALEPFAGILIGISAGTMNSAETVYAQPELEGESISPGYQRFLTGLGITDRMVLPHYQVIKDAVLDGKRVMEDITYPDSFGREFYALPDGSYILVEDGVQTLFGEAYLVKEGKLQQICEKEKSICLGKRTE